MNSNIKVIIKLMIRLKLSLYVRRLGPPLLYQIKLEKSRLALMYEYI